MSRLLPVGGERYLVWLTGTSDEDGEPFEWCVSHEDSEEAAETCVQQMQRAHGPEFASAYRFERVVVADAGTRKPFVGTGPLPDVAPDAAPALLPEGEVFF